MATIDRTRPRADYETLPMFEVSDELAPRIQTFGLERNVREMRELGYTVFDSDAPEAFIDKLRAAIRTAALETKGNYFGINENGASCDTLLERDAIFAEAVMYPKLLAMIEFMCGKGALVSQVSGSLRMQGSKAMDIHCDQDWLPAPMPEHNALLTACWYCDDITGADAGATRVIPKTHLLRRQPNPEEVEAATGAVPVVCSKGSIALWDGRLWHANYGRSLPGERVLLHATYCRLAYRPLEDYSPIANDLIDQHGPQMASLLGRDLWFGNHAFNNGGVDMNHYMNTWRSARR